MKPAVAVSSPASSLSAQVFSALAASRRAGPTHGPARRRLARLAAGFLRRDLPAQLMAPGWGSGQ